MPTAHRVRTSLVLAASAATVIAAVWMPARGGPSVVAASSDADDGMQLTARLTTSNILTGPHEQYLAVTITAPQGAAHTRPPITLAVVIDRSGSMSGEPIQNAKAAAARLIGQLDPTDAFTVITYSSADQVVMPMARATDANKQRARDAIARISDDGATCISCGLTRGAGELARSPIDGGLRRIVLISDGQANAGVYDRGELIDLAAHTAVMGDSITALGVGLDFDEQTMMKIAEVGRGNYYFVEDTANLMSIFERELGGLTETVASNVRLVLSDGPGVRIEEALGYPMVRSGSSVVIPIADLRAGESRKVVFRVTVAARTTGSFVISQVHLGWRRVTDGLQRGARAVAQVEVVDDERAVASSVDVPATQGVEEALSAKALQDATTVYETQGADAANAVLQQRVQAVRANAYAKPETVERIDRAAGEAMNSFKTSAPAKAKKVSGKAAFELAR
jgi:Ca-activated chloride channel family protein